MPLKTVHIATDKFSVWKENQLTSYYASSCETVIHIINLLHHDCNFLDIVYLIYFIYFVNSEVQFTNVK